MAYIGATMGINALITCQPRRALQPQNFTAKALPDGAMAKVSGGLFGIRAPCPHAT